jgi:hypothetical protein
MQPAPHTCPNSCIPSNFHLILPFKLECDGDRYAHVFESQRIAIIAPTTDFVLVTKIEQLLSWKLQRHLTRAICLGLAFAITSSSSGAALRRSYLHCECVSQLYQVYCQPLAPQHPSPSVRNAKVYFEPAAISVCRSAVLLFSWAPFNGFAK